MNDIVRNYPIDGAGRNIIPETKREADVRDLLVRIERRKLLGVGDRHGGPYLHLTDQQRELVIEGLRLSVDKRGKP